MYRSGSRQRGWFALTLVMALFLGACGSNGSGEPAGSEGTGETAEPTESASTAAEPAVGVEDDRLVIGIHGPKSGPAAALTEGIVAGFNLYVEDINARGGIEGRQIEVIDADDQYTVSGGAGAARQLVDKAFMVFNVVGADPAIGAHPVFEEAGVPYLTVALPFKTAQESEVSFLFPTPLELLGEALPSFIQSELDPDGTSTVAVMSENQDIFRDMKDHFMTAAGEADLEIVVEETFEREAGTYVPNVQRVKDAGADLVVLIGGVGVPGVLKAAQDIGYEPTWTGAGAWTFNLFNAVSGGLMEGIRAVRAAGGADLPDYDAFITKLRESGREESPTDELAYAGWADAKFLEQVLLRLEGNFTRENVIQALEERTAEDNPITLDGFQPLWYGPDRHYGSAAAIPSQVEDGEWVATGEPQERFGQ